MVGGGKPEQTFSVKKCLDTFSKKVNRIIRRPTLILQDLWQKFFRLTGWCSGIAPSEYSGKKKRLLCSLSSKGIGRINARAPPGIEPMDQFVF